MHDELPDIPSPPAPAATETERTQVTTTEVENAAAAETEADLPDIPSLPAVPNTTARGSATAETAATYQPAHTSQADNDDVDDATLCDAALEMDSSSQAAGPTENSKPAATTAGQFQKQTYFAADTFGILQQGDVRQRQLDVLTVLHDRKPAMVMQQRIITEEYLAARLEEHAKRIVEPTGELRGGAAWLCDDWRPTEVLQLNIRDYETNMPGMSNTAARLPDMNDYQGKLEGVFYGHETVEMDGERARYLEELSRALCKTLTSLQAACVALVNQVHKIDDLALRQTICKETIPTIVYPVADATALAVELMFSHIHIRRQNVLRAARATMVDCVNALLQPMLKNDRLF